MDSFLSTSRSSLNWLTSFCEDFRERVGSLSNLKVLISRLLFVECELEPPVAEPAPNFADGGYGPDPDSVYDSGLDIVYYYKYEICYC